MGCLVSFAGEPWQEQSVLVCFKMVPFLSLTKETRRPFLLCFLYKPGGLQKVTLATLLAGSPWSVEDRLVHSEHPAIRQLQAGFAAAGPDSPAVSAASAR